MHTGVVAGQDGRWAIGEDPILERRVRQELIDTLASQAGVDPHEAASNLEGYDFKASFARRFGPLGLDPGQLPDVMAGHLLALWTIVHGGELPQAGQAQGAATVRQQCAGELASSPMAATAANRQLVGQALMCEAMLSLDAYEDARSRSDHAALKTMARNANANVRQRQRIDLRKLRFTPKGLHR